MKIIAETKRRITHFGLFINIKWMHGDADAYTKTVEQFDNEADLINACTMLKELAVLHRNHHNAMCDVTAQRDVDCPPINQFLDKWSEEDSLYDAFECVGIESESDATNCECSAVVEDWHAVRVTEEGTFDLSFGE